MQHNRFIYQVNKDFFISVKKLKSFIKSHILIYRLAKVLYGFAAFTPYVFQTLFPQRNSKNLMLGYQGKIKGWITFDKMPGADYLGDIKNLKIFPGNGMDKVYASHVLEHLNCHEAEIALNEIFRILKRGGEFFLVVPDIINLSTLLQTDLAEISMDIIYGVVRPKKDWNPQHKYGYTKPMLEKLLADVGFVDIQVFKPFIQDASMFSLADVKVSLCLKGLKK